MSLNDKEKQSSDEVLFAGSMRHRKLPRARRRTRQAPEKSRDSSTASPLTDLMAEETAAPVEVVEPTTWETDIAVDVLESATLKKSGKPTETPESMVWENTKPVGTIDPMTGEITIPDNGDDYDFDDAPEADMNSDTLSEDFDFSSFDPATDGDETSSHFSYSEEPVGSRSSRTKQNKSKAGRTESKGNRQHETLSSDASLDAFSTGLSAFDDTELDAFEDGDDLDAFGDDDSLDAFGDDDSLDAFDNDTSIIHDTSETPDEFSAGASVNDNADLDFTELADNSETPDATESALSDEIDFTETGDETASQDGMYLADLEDDDLGADGSEEGEEDEEDDGRKSFFQKLTGRKKGNKKKKFAIGKAVSDETEADTDESESAADESEEDADGEESPDEPEDPEVTHNPVIRYDPELTYGLTTEEVSDRKAEGLINVTVRKGQKTVKQIVLSHTLTYFNLLNILLGILVATTGQWKNMLFLGIIVGNSVIGIFQELKVKSLIDNLTVITAARVFAIRDGNEEEIPVDDIVVDDVIKLEPGDQIVTDGRVFDCRGLEVNESMLTGESQPVKKKDGDSVLSGSFIIAGTALQRVDKVGNESYASQLVAKASHKKRASSEMQRTIGRIIKVVSVVIIPVGLLLYQSQMIANGGVFAEAIIRTVSGIIGMIPEGLVLLTSVSFIIGVGRLANKKALVQEMPSIESLARANIICTDKTGTITTGELRVNEVLPMGRTTRDEVMDIMAHINSAFTDTNVTQDALNAAFGQSKGWAVRDLIPFSSERKFRAVSFDEHGDYVLGAPEFIVPHNKAALSVVDTYSQQGYRVLLLGRSKGIDSDTGDKGSVTPIAAIIISDVIKEDAKETFAYFAKAGVEIKVLSGDNPLTVSSVAQKAGVVGAERYVDATKLPDDPAALQQAVMKYSVFGRVKPEQKQAFVKAWQAAGKTVAMVGDGVNDVLAIKDADCGIAMASGSEAAKQAAHIVLMDSDFSSMKDIVKEGKTIIANIERVSSLYLTKTIYSCLLSVIFILLKTPYPFTTLQMGLINLCGIGMPSFLLTLEQQEDVTSDGFLKHVLQTALPAALTMVTSMLVVQILNAIFSWPTDIFSTFNLMLGGLVSMLVVASVCWPLAPYRKFVLAVSAAVFLGAVILLPNFYDMHSIFMWWSLLLIPLSLLVAIMISLYSRLTQKVIIEFNRLRLKMQAGRKRYDKDLY